MEINKAFTLSKAGLLSLCIAASLAQAQDDAIEEEIYVTGYRGALLNSTDAKRNSVGFSDEVFADDMGKMPSLNLAESLARIPGVQINREVDGEGQQISVRGLGPNFTKVALNGNSIAVASTGSLDSVNRDRQVDLDLFPTELFSSLTVEKTAHGSQLEGGVSGYVNMSTLRPSDMDEGHNFRFSADAAYKETASAVNPKLALTYGFNSDKFGALVSVVSKSNESRSDGFEQDANFQSGCFRYWEDGQDPAESNGTCAVETGWTQFEYTNIASPDYVAANPGSTLGEELDIESVSGLTVEELDQMGIGRIQRWMTKTGTKDSTSALFSFEYRPMDSMELALDVITAETSADFNRTEAMMLYRNTFLRYDLAMLPSNVETIDRGDGLRLVSGDFYSARPWIGDRDYKEDLEFTSFMPSMDWQITDMLHMNLSYSHTESDFYRSEPYIIYFGPEGTIGFDYNGGGGVVPKMSFSESLATVSDEWSLVAGPRNGNLGRENTPTIRWQQSARQTETKGFHADFSWGEDADVNGYKWGIASDEVYSNIEGIDGGATGTAFNARIEAMAPDFLGDGFVSYLQDAPYDNLGKDIDGYQGIDGMVVLDWDRFKDAVDFDSFEPVQGTGSHAGGSATGTITEKMLAFYGEVNKEFDLDGRNLRTNAGGRYVTTEQIISSYGSLETNVEYSKFLPSLSAVLDVADDVKLRVSTSRSLTRATPSDMFPLASFGGNTISTGSAGNPNLKPFESTNLDIGGEYYFSDMAYVGWNYYKKELKGFTMDDTTLVQFQDLPSWGIETDDLSPVQEDELSDCGGAGSAQCITSVSTKVNIPGTVELSGFEIIWVQPLDMVVEGLGFNASANNIKQEADEGTEIGGISDSRNFTLYYENEDFQSRVTYYHQNGADAGSAWGTPLYSRDRTQIDLSASYNLPVMEDYNLVLTFDAYNLTNAPISTYIEEESQTFRAYFPGATYSFGIRGSF